MPISPETIAAGKCYKIEGGPPRRVLIIQEKRLTFILRGDATWTVQRYHQDVDTFAKAAICEINCSTLEDVTADLPS